MGRSNGSGEHPESDEDFTVRCQSRVPSFPRFFLMTHTVIRKTKKRSTSNPFSAEKLEKRSEQKCPLTIQSRCEIPKRENPVCTSSEPDESAFEKNEL